MAYYPKSQIKTNLYTNGGELVYKKNSEPYSGYYWINSSGKYFTGKTPQDTPYNELIKPFSNDAPSVPSSTTINNVVQKSSTLALSYGDPYVGDDPNLYNERDILSYALLSNTPSDPPLTTYLPTYSPTLPTEQDYKVGEFRRYFCKKTNEIIYLEISKDTYDKLVKKDSKIAFQLYQPFNLSWRITGNIAQVASINANSTILASVKQNLPMLPAYLKNDFTKYYK